MSRIQAAILDWAGTVVDCGSLAPMGAFVRAFAELGVAIGVEDARGPMGMAKREHIAAVLAVPRVTEAWQERHGTPPDHAAMERVFAVFEPLNADSVVEHAGLVPGAAEALAELASMAVRIGSTTGYTRPIMRRLLPAAAAAGYVPEVTVCAGDLAAGRPSPLMMWHAMAAMGVWPAWTVVKVDDTPVGIGEGRAAGTWTVGVAMTGNIVGLDAHDLAALPDSERTRLRARATAEFEAVGTDLVVDSVADLPNAIRALDRRIVAGERPTAAGRPDGR